MARFPWALPDGFDAAMRKALRNLLQALKNAQQSIPEDAFAALRSGNLEAFIHLIDWSGVEKEFEAFKQTIADQAKLSALQVLHNPSQGGVFSQLSFDLIDKKAVEWAAKRAGELVVAIQDDMRQTIRTTISNAIAGNHTYDQAARIIRKTLPLSPRDAKAVLNFSDRTAARLIKAGMSPLKAQIKADAMAEKYAAKLVAKRATTIARTEILHSSMQGRFMGWAEGVASNLIDNQSVKEWIAETDACPICKPLDGKVVPWDKPFVTEDIEIMMPNAHPNCRCVATILPPDFAGQTLTHEPIVNDGSAWFSPSGATSATFSFGKSYSLVKRSTIKPTFIQPVVKTALHKHLSGQHDQSTHGRGHGSYSYNMTVSDGSNVPTGTLVHLTSEKNAKDILVNGFRTGNRSLGGEQWGIEGAVFASRWGSDSEYWANQLHSEHSNLKLAAVKITLSPTAKVLTVNQRIHPQYVKETLTRLGVGESYNWIESKKKQSPYTPYDALLAQWASKNGYDAVEFSAETIIFPSKVQKHLLGLHDQSTHGHGHGHPTEHPFELKPAEEYNPYMTKMFGQNNSPLILGWGYKPNWEINVAESLASDVVGATHGYSSDPAYEAHYKMVINDPNYPKLPVTKEMLDTATHDMVWARDQGYTSFDKVPEDNRPEIIRRAFDKYLPPEQQMAYAEKENAFVLDKFRSMKLDDGKTIGEAMDSLATTAIAQLTEDVVSSPLSLTMRDSKLTRFINDERYKTAYEVTSMGKGVGRQEYLGRRGQVETNLGIPWNGAEKAPVYGIINNTRDNVEGMIYGNSKITFKEDVKHRTTVSIGDSIDDNVQRVFWASDLAENKITAKDFWQAAGKQIAHNTLNPRLSPYFSFKEGSIKYVERVNGYVGLKNIRDISHYHYIESQIHGGVHLSDVASITVPPTYRISKAVQAKLDSLGIQVYREDNGWSADQ